MGPPWAMATRESAAMTRARIFFFDVMLEA